jgi:P pilus assembly chaperone PapD
VTLFAAFGAAGGVAHAQLVVDRLVIDFDAGAPARQDVLLQNQSKDRYYITVTPYEITDPGAEKPTKVTKTDPEALGLLVTPNRMVLEPGASRSIRIVSLNGPVVNDRIYRVLIAPQVGALKTDPTPDGTRAVALKILTAYEALVIVRPPKAQANVVGERSAAGLTLKNTGNSNALIYEGSACEVAPAAGAKPKCVDLPAHRMYPGADWKVPLPHPTDTVTYSLRMNQAQNPRILHY